MNHEDENEFNFVGIKERLKTFEVNKNMLSGQRDKNQRQNWPSIEQKEKFSSPVKPMPRPYQTNRLANPNNVMDNSSIQRGKLQNDFRNPTRNQDFKNISPKSQQLNISPPIPPPPSRPIRNQKLSGEKIQFSEIAKESSGSSNFVIPNKTIVKIQSNLSENFQHPPPPPPPSKMFENLKKLNSEVSLPEIPEPNESCQKNDKNSYKNSNLLHMATIPLPIPPLPTESRKFESENQGNIKFCNTDDLPPPVPLPPPFVRKYSTDNQDNRKNSATIQSTDLPPLVPLPPPFIRKSEQDDRNTSSVSLDLPPPVSIPPIFTRKADANFLNNKSNLSTFDNFQPPITLKPPFMKKAESKFQDNKINSSISDDLPPPVPLPPPFQKKVDSQIQDNKSNSIMSNDLPPPVPLPPFARKAESQIQDNKSNSTTFNDLPPPVPLAPSFSRKIEQEKSDKRNNSNTPNDLPIPIPVEPFSVRKFDTKNQDNFTSSNLKFSDNQSLPVLPPPILSTHKMMHSDLQPPLIPPPPASFQNIKIIPEIQIDSNQGLPLVPTAPMSLKSKKKTNILVGWVQNQSQNSDTKSSDLENVSKTANFCQLKLPIGSRSTDKEKDQSSTASTISNLSLTSSTHSDAEIEEQYDEDNQEDISNESWYFNITKDESSELMKKYTKKGTFIMRPSQDNQYVLMVRIDEKQIKKFKIQRHKEGWILGDPSNMKRIYPNLLKLMEYYKQNGIKFGNANIALKETINKK